MKQMRIWFAAALLLGIAAIATNSAQAQETLLDDFESGALDGHWFSPGSGEDFPDSPYTIGQVITAPDQGGVPSPGSFSMQFWQKSEYETDWNAAPEGSKPWRGQLRWYASGPDGSTTIDLSGLTGLAVDVHWDLSNISNPTFQFVVEDVEGKGMFYWAVGQGQIDDLLWSPVTWEYTGDASDTWNPATWTTPETTEENFLIDQIVYIAFEVNSNDGSSFAQTGPEYATTVDNFKVTGITTTIPDVEGTSVGDWSIY